MQVVRLEAAQKANQGSNPTGFTLSKPHFVLRTITVEIRGAIAIGKAHLNVSKRRDNQGPFMSWRLGLQTLQITASALRCDVNSLNQPFEIQLGTIHT